MAFKTDQGSRRSREEGGGQWGMTRSTRPTRTRQKGCAHSSCTAAEEGEQARGRAVSAGSADMDGRTMHGPAAKPGTVHACFCAPCLCPSAHASHLPLEPRGRVLVKQASYEVVVFRGGAWSGNGQALQWLFPHAGFYEAGLHAYIRKLLYACSPAHSARTLSRLNKPCCSAKQQLLLAPSPGMRWCCSACKVTARAARPAHFSMPTPPTRRTRDGLVLLVEDLGHELVEGGVEKGRATHGALVQHAAQRPQVRRGAVRGPLGEELGCHVHGRAAHGLQRGKQGSRL